MKGRYIKKALDFGIEFPFDAPSECSMARELVSDGLKDIH